mgnify:CR=1 FL=1
MFVNQQLLVNCEMYKLLAEREGSIAKELAGILIAVEPEAAKTLEYIKNQFPNFTEHGMQHSLRIMNYIYSIMSEELKQNISDVEIFCFIMSAFFHDMGMTLVDLDDKDEQRTNHHLYAKIPIKEYFSRYIQLIPERKRLEKCIVFICEAHGREINDLYNDADFRKVEKIEGQTLRYGLLAVLLRIGDLMDLEECRICEFNMHLNEEYYNNPLSILHNRRHMDDITYDYTPNKIVVKVLTDNREKYKVWDQWLSYLDNEIMYANTHYLGRDVSDFFQNYKLPKVVKEVLPSGDAKFSVEEIRFQVDDTGTLWDILTKSIYTEELDYIRELIQNAIDATLLKMYIDSNTELLYQSPRAWSCNDKVIIAYSEKEGILWVEDNGIGMNKKELSNYLFKTAKSGYRYMRKREFIFPAIAKFGIGFAACLTKADKIQIFTKTKSDTCVKAEIEAKSTVAFIEQDMNWDWQGTTIILHVKEKYSFDELKGYIFNCFGYPSVEVDVVNMDALRLYKEEEKLFNENILQMLEKATQKRKEKVNEFLPDYKCLLKMRSILSEDKEGTYLIGKISDILDNIFHKSIIKEDFLKIVRNVTRNEDGISQLRKEVNNKIEKIREKLETYPEILFPILKRELKEIVEYKQLVMEFDDTFGIKQIYKDKKVNKSSHGIIFIPTSFIDYDLGIEWQSVTAFLFNNGKIVKNLIRMAEDGWSNIWYDGTLSLDEIADADYEMNVKLQQEEAEDYYENIIKGQDEDLYDDYSFLYDLVLLKNNEFYKVSDVPGEKMDHAARNDDVVRKDKLFENMILPEEYEGEEFIFGVSQLYQDGILFKVNPQEIIPFGSAYVKVNLTGKSRFELNVSRHELNNNREVIKAWVKETGCVIQKRVASNCIKILQKNDLKYEEKDLLLEEAENDFAKENLLSMEYVLSGFLL